MKVLYVIAGSLCVGLGVAGIVLPLLPTTPFLLLAAWCYAKGSQRFYDWLVSHKQLGHYIRTFRSKEGVPPRVKIKAISVMWLTMCMSGYFLRHVWWALAILFVCGCGITLYIRSLPTAKSD